ncbi:right-handed parallel beta-helix repeat-containing protein [Methylococcus sp. EFPC2]|uniref:right-handed parallel beta-helix repeat-containing protein n=1 Tax=Methylococcus sp. EFPC2 TaxID=2812648 RepID=UPI001967CA30|nr:right-handed parallel beta-helix repeat-containing protein [Methylococcus sp. EFPC2]QSA98934.1 right-handed parallel beta-helix repeat-containing protein [Methylococcus sp. EFPC2]
MSKMDKAGVAALISLLLTISSETDAAVEKAFYVSPNGNDRNAGSINSPFATAKRAQSAVRAYKTIDSLVPVTVYFRQGIYYFNETLNLLNIDSGTINAPITYQAYGLEKVVFSGGLNVPASQIKPLGNIQISGVNTANSKKFQVVDLRAAGIAAAPASSWARSEINSPEKDPLAPEELFLNQRPMQVARWPNGEWAYTQNSVFIKTPKIPYSNEMENRVINWRRPNTWLKGYWGKDWYDEAIQVSFVNTVDHTVRLKDTPEYGIVAGARYYVLNNISELDAPGEYYIDRSTRKAYFIPDEEVNSDTTLTVTKLSAPIVATHEASNIIFKGILFEGGRGNGVEIIGGDHISVFDGIVRNIGKTGIVIQGGKNHEIKGNEIYATGTGGIYANGGERVNLSPASFTISNNHIHDYSRNISTYRAGIDARGVGIAISGNIIHNAPHVAIWVDGNNHLVDKNNIYRVCLDTSDSGAIYIGRDWSARGTVISNNYIHEIAGLPGKGDVSGIYLDDFSSGIKIEKNILSNIYRGVLIGGGRDNLITNNIFAFNQVSLSLDARGTTWAKAAISPGSDLQKKLALMPYRSSVWSKQYPSLTNILYDDPATPKGNSVKGNYIYESGKMLIDQLAIQYGDFKSNLITRDNLGLRNPGANDFSVSDWSQFKARIPDWQSIDNLNVWFK